jgi:hypothetical protein
LTKVLAIVSNIGGLDARYGQADRRAVFLFGSGKARADIASAARNRSHSEPGARGGVDGFFRALFRDAVAFDLTRDAAMGEADFQELQTCTCEMGTAVSRST